MSSSAGVSAKRKGGVLLPLLVLAVLVTGLSFSGFYLYTQYKATSDEVTKVQSDAVDSQNAEESNRDRLDSVNEDNNKLSDDLKSLRKHLSSDEGFIK